MSAAQPAAAEQRSFDRHASSIPIWFAYFNRNHYHPARMHDYGEGGIRFYTEFPVKEGSIILIRLDPTCPVPASASCKPGFRNLSLLEVRWCRETAKDPVATYEVGGRYF